MSNSEFLTQCMYECFGTDFQDVHAELFNDEVIGVKFANPDLKMGDLQDDADRAIAYFASKGFDFKVRLKINNFTLVPNNDEY